MKAKNLIQTPPATPSDPDAPPEKKEAPAANGGFADGDKTGFLYTPTQTVNTSGTGAFPFQDIDERLGWCEPAGAAEPEPIHISDEQRERIGLLTFFQILEEEACGQGEASLAQRFVTWIAACNLAGVPWAAGSTRELARQCKGLVPVSHEVLNRRIRRLAARLPDIYRDSARADVPARKEREAA